ncbi:aminoglycoside phosphotransferase [Nakamurella silvestris]|nr:aminoglycoside phosphotransferase [Nakamurella silvestris]
MSIPDTVLAELLRSWLPDQRWFAGKGGEIGPIRLVRRTELSADVSGARVEHILLEVATTAGEHWYQIFLGWRADLPQRLQHVTIATVEGVTAYDALHDPDVTAHLIRGIAAGDDWGDLRLRPEPDADIDTSAHGRVISGEQSNTSVVFGDSSILKVFRRIEPGENPDLQVHRGLHTVGSTSVAAPLGAIGADIDGVPSTLGFLAEFFANSADGWAMATASVRDLLNEGDLRADEVGGDFAAEAERLGETVAHVHADLAKAFGQEVITGEQLSELLSTMSAEALSTAARIPSLAGHAEAIAEVFTVAAHSPTGLQVQRIHGDLHLGQTLRTLYGWAIIDFEGEPAKPLAARVGRQPLAKDIAGMLRSLDYAGHHRLAAGAGEPQQVYRAAEWTQRNRQAFLRGYQAVAADSSPLSAELLRAFELDKAVYEVAYEHDNRPGWEPIPLHAVTALINAGGK